MTRRRAPRPAGAALQAALRLTAPKTRLAAVQAVWAEAVGERVAGAARPVSEREGAVVIACSDPVWTQELDLMQDRLLAALRDRLGEDAPRTLRFRVEGERD